MVNGVGDRGLRIWGIILEVSDDFAKLGEDLSLTEREFGIFRLIIEGDDHVLNLKKMGEEVWQCTERSGQRYLVTPEEVVSVSVLDSVPGVEELCDAVLPDMVGVLACLVPSERCSKIQETHGVR